MEEKVIIKDELSEPLAQSIEVESEAFKCAIESTVDATTSDGVEDCVEAEVVRRIEDLISEVISKREEEIDRAIAERKQRMAEFKDGLIQSGRSADDALKVLERFEKLAAGDFDHLKSKKFEEFEKEVDCKEVVLDLTFGAFEKTICEVFANDLDAKVKVVEILHKCKVAMRTCKDFMDKISGALFEMYLLVEERAEHIERLGLSDEEGVQQSIEKGVDSYLDCAKDIIDEVCATIGTDLRNFLATLVSVQLGKEVCSAKELFQTITKQCKDFDRLVRSTTKEFSISGSRLTYNLQQEVDDLSLLQMVTKDSKDASI